MFPELDRKSYHNPEMNPSMSQKVLETAKRQELARIQSQRALSYGKAVS
jgi:hypothetical protein